MLYLRLAYRNIFRQKGRLILNLILLVGAFTGIVVFKGFKVHVLETMKSILIETQYGHIQVAKSSFWDNAAVDQLADKMLVDPSSLVEKISKLEEVQFASPRVEFYGLLNTEEKSLPAFFIGFQPEMESELQKRLFFAEGESLSASKQVIIGVGLQKILKAKVGDDITIVSPTIDGSINAMDLKVTGVFSTGFEEVDNRTVYLSLKDAQKIYDSNAVNRILITLKNDQNLDLTTEKISRLVATEAPSDQLRAKNWRELGELFNQVENFYNFQNLAIELILMALILLSVSNTMDMTVFERISEIGTMRALGDKESDIRILFLIEAIILGAIAILVSVPFSFILMKVVSNLKISILLPLASQPISLELIPYLGSFFAASALCFFSIVIASLWPAKKGAKVSIVTALKAKI